MPEIEPVESLVHKLHHTGAETKRLMENTTVASGAVVGGPVSQPPTPAPAQSPVPGPSGGSGTGPG